MKEKLLQYTVLWSDLQGDPLSEAEDSHQPDPRGRPRLSYVAFRVAKQQGYNKSAQDLPGYLPFIYAVPDTWTEIWA